MEYILIEESFKNRKENNNTTKNHKIILFFITLDLLCIIGIIFSLIYYQKFLLTILLILFILFSIVIFLISKKNKNKKIDEIELKEMKTEINKLIQINKRLFSPDQDIKEEDKTENMKLIEEKGKLKNIPEEEIKKQVKRTQLLEDMSTMGSIVKQQIIKEKEENPEKFISTKEIIEKKLQDDQLYSLGIFSKVLENQGTTTVIEKNEDGDKEIEEKNMKTSLQFLVNGMSDKKKYNLHFDFGQDKNQKILNDVEERKKLHDKLRKKLSKEYKIKEEEIIITFPRKGSYQITIIFQSKDFELNEKDLLNKFKNEKGELGKLKSIEKGIILDGCKLTTSMLDYRGNNSDGGWAGQGETRGGEEYIPPIGWVGYGLKVLDTYGDNTWLGMSDSKGEWCVAYHGVANNQEPKEVSRIAGIIYKTNFKRSIWGKATDDPDLRHPGKVCGLGVYCSPDIKYAEGYAGITEFNGKKYKCVLMLRVNPEKIRQSSSYPKEYVLEPTTDEIRPYRILLKET